MSSGGERGDGRGDGDDEERSEDRRQQTSDAPATAGAGADAGRSSDEEESDGDGQAVDLASIEGFAPLLRALAAGSGLPGGGEEEDDEESDEDYQPSDDDEAAQASDSEDESGDEGGAGAAGGPVAGTRRRQRRRSRLPRHARHPFELEQQRAIADSELSRDLWTATGGLEPKHALSLRRRAEQRGWASADRVNFGMRLVPSRPRNKLMTNVGSRIYSAQFSRSGDVLVCAAQDACVRILDTAQWAVHKTIEARDIHWTVTSTDLSPDERFIIYSTISDCVHLCNVRGEYEVHEPLYLGNGAGFGVWNAKFAAGGTELVAGTSDESLVVYDVERKEPVSKVHAHDDDINSVDFADRTFKTHVLFSGSDDNLIKVWDRRTMDASARRSPPVGVLAGHSDGLTSVSSRGDGNYLVSNAKDQCAKLWDMRCMRNPEQQRQLPRVPSRFHWDYRWMDYPGWHETYKHPHDCSIMTYRGHEVLNTLIRAYFSPAATTGQRYIYSGSRDGSVYIWDVLTGELKSKLSTLQDGDTPRRVHNAPVRDVSWHPTLPVLCSASWDGSVAVWDYDPKHDPSAPPREGRGRAAALRQLLRALVGNP